MKRKAGVDAGIVALLLTTALGCAVGGGGGSGRLSDSTIASGILEALRIGTQNAVAQTSREGGFFDNPLIRIALPESLQTMATALRVIGFGGQIDTLELTMNRAAERASGEAIDVFWTAIGQITFADVRAIWHGGDTAATDYFRRTTGEELFGRFQPIVTEKMHEVGLVRKYDDLISRYTAIPFADKPALDMGSYVTNRALDGLFTVLGEEERKIREHPVARTTELLRKVFG